MPRKRPPRLCVQALVKNRALGVLLTWRVTRHWSLTGHGACSLRPSLELGATLDSAWFPGYTHLTLHVALVLVQLSLSLEKESPTHAPR